MTIYQIIFMSIVGGIIGWFTNYLAVKMLFRPLKPIKIPVLNYEIVGLIPKRRIELAKKIGDVVQDELISIDEIMDKLVGDKEKKELITHIKFRISQIVSDKMHGILSAFKPAVINYIDDIVDKEFSKFFNDVNGDFLKNLSKKVNISKMVEDKLNQLDMKEMEELIIKVSNKELKEIVILGGVLGFAIGLIQALILRFI